LAPVMNRVWLAVLLGVLVGLGAGMMPEAQLTAPSGVRPQQEMLLQATKQATTVPANSADIYAVALSLLVGVVVAMPLFLLARRRSK
jgi:hypothetical protein